MTLRDSTTAFVITTVMVFTLALSGIGTIAVGSLRARHTTLVEIRRQAADISVSVDEVLAAASDQSPAALRCTQRQFNVFRKVLDLDGIAMRRLFCRRTARRRRPVPASGVAGRVIDKTFAAAW